MLKILFFVMKLNSKKLNVVLKKFDYLIITKYGQILNKFRLDKNIFLLMFLLFEKKTI